MLGIIQSRLSPRDGGKYQSWPESWWQTEFKLASKYGFGHIEWIYDDNPNNTLNDPNGYKSVLKEILNNDVTVEAICADYFIDNPLYDDTIASKNIAVLNGLILSAYKLGAKNIVVPILEHSQLITIEKVVSFIRNLRPCLDYANHYLINICLESDLSPTIFSTLLDEIDNDRVGVCYDTGNSAAIGYDVVEEFESYGNYIKHVHLKDRAFGGPNVEIGKGVVGFNLVLNQLNKLNYTNPLTLQCARPVEYDLEFIKKQLDTMKGFINVRNK